MSRVAWRFANMAVCAVLAHRTVVLNSRGELDAGSTLVLVACALAAWSVLSVLGALLDLVRPQPMPGPARGRATASGATAMRARPVPRDLARHEAGHAVVAHVLGFEVLAVSTVPTARNDGRTTFAWSVDPGVGQVAVSLAGEMAQTRPSAHLRPDGGLPVGDLLDAQALALSVAMIEDRNPSTVLDEAMDVARRILDENAAAVDALAARLWPDPVTLPGPEAVAVIEAASAVRT